MRKNQQLSKQNSMEKFPYRFLLRWTWPEHIEKALRRAMWSWLNELSGDTEAAERTDQLGMHLCWLMAVHPETPPAVLDLLSQQSSASLAERVAENPSTWPTTLARLAAHQASAVRIAVASNHNTPPDVVAHLAHDECVDVRYAVAENCNRTMDTLRELCDDDNGHVAARSKKTLQKMSKPEEPAKLVTSQPSRMKRAAEGC